MFPFERLHHMAATRGDGLRPELLALLRHRTAIEANPKVVEIGTQAGPSPMPALTGALPGNVLPFPAAAGGLEHGTRAKSK
ncbi:hypothetical protein [Chelativorans salis]|uniref:Uncharacterized protein n=1 Tax=Chelativorans salis TaxID=2978478 RepID=A0ABT2LLH8_9HYPH|nr:hypothetical protein [Chelativorans sp. EGI FJ00035]MCT7375287.1 hypothetical protein [Chelativorans sp. EGI FJ00035]